ncbi:protealysin inhibitor emfourin [Vallicoccus soli]|uniref:protealysin inhibitor emfourin n=1 Tax=Vallicoccus soli TaxID=2339232 RepID=UPI0010593775|nr:protealysin inhibitor emfourin [Vallicoccus soli]
MSRSGGFAGLVRRGVLDVDPGSDGGAWQPLAELAAAGPAEPADPALRDAYVWTIEVGDARTVVPDAALDERTRQLAQRTLDEGAPDPR